MPTTLTLDGENFLLNGTVTFPGTAMEGKLPNSRMIQAIFDDANPVTRERWAYPDTGAWDPNRNTDEFCAMLPVYRAHGLLGVTVGLQGGGSIYEPDVYDAYDNSAFEADGTLKPAYLDRLTRILRAADDSGMVVIVSCFYGKQLKVFSDEAAATAALENATRWLLASGFRNIIVEIVNEAHPNCAPYYSPERIPERIRQVKAIEHDGRRLLVGCSPHPAIGFSGEAWLDEEDVSLLHGNGKRWHELASFIQQWRDSESFRSRPRPLVINEDSPVAEHLDIALAAGASWGFYHQGFGSGYRYEMLNCAHFPRETRFEDLSGYQTVPVNWSINDPWKRAFFERLKARTGGRD